MKDLFSVPDVARHMGVHQETVRRWVKTGRLKAYKVGQFIKIPPESLDEFKSTRVYNVEYAKLPEKSDLTPKTSLE